MLQGVCLVLQWVNAVQVFELLTEFAPDPILECLEFGQRHHPGVDLLELIGDVEPVLEPILLGLCIELLGDLELEVEDTPLLLILDLASGHMLEQLHQELAHRLIIVEPAHFLVEVVLDDWEFELLEDSAGLEVGDAGVPALLFDHCVEEDGGPVVFYDVLVLGVPAVLPHQGVRVQHLLQGRQLLGRELQVLEDVQPGLRDQLGEFVSLFREVG